MTPQLDRSVDRAFVLRSLPVFPAVALELIDRGVAGASAIASLLERDPATLENGARIQEAAERAAERIDDELT